MEGVAMKKIKHQVLHVEIRAERSSDRILPFAPRRCGRSAAPSG